MGSAAIGLMGVRVVPARRIGTEDPCRPGRLPILRFCLCSDPMKSARTADTTRVIEWSYGAGMEFLRALN